MIKFHELQKFMQVEEIAASHLRRAHEANANHSGRVLQHKALRHFAQAEQQLNHAMTCLSKGEK